jgi:Eukaryotic aspartyl protease
LDSSTQLLSITIEQYESLQSLYFVIGGNTIELTPNAQIWPRSLTGDGDRIYLMVQDIKRISSSMDFILGTAFLERFYSVFDSGNRQVGLARTSFTNATTN